MSRGMFTAHVSELDGLHAEWLLDMATAGDYAGWDKRNRESWWHRQVGRMRRGGSVVDDTPARRRAAFFWNGQPLGGAELKNRATRQLGSRLAA